MEASNNLFAHRTVADVVADDYRRGAVFKKFGIDFCCGGGKTVEAACAAGGVSYTQLGQALLAADQPRGTSLPSDPRGWDLGFLADYIVNVHHTYVRENLPILLQFTGKVARVHGGHRPELVEIARLVEELAGEMDQHMMKEEKVLFPHVRKLAEARRDGAPTERPVFGTVKNPIRAMEHEHDRAGDLMRRIRVLTDDFVPPMDACNTYRASFAKLEEFEEDLHRHVHLENNILFPATVKLEEGGQA
jgi:regulator of cell morphogenesis and NO signaling